MESKKTAGPVLIQFKDQTEMVDLAIRIELKYFVARLLFSYYSKRV